MWWSHYIINLCVNMRLLYLGWWWCGGASAGLWRMLWWLVCQASYGRLQLQPRTGQSHGTVLLRPNCQHSLVGPSSFSSWGITTTGPLISKCTWSLPWSWVMSWQYILCCSTLVLTYLPHPRSGSGWCLVLKPFYITDLNPWQKQLCVNKCTAMITTVELWEAVYHPGTSCLGS